MNLFHHATTKVKLPTPNELLEDSVRSALDHVQEKQPVPRPILENARRALEALPLGTAEYARRLAHLRNAENYARGSEFGAARFELNALLARASQEPAGPCPRPSINTVEPKRHQHASVLATQTALLQ